MAQLGAAADSNGIRTSPETAQQVIAAMYVNSSQCPIVSGGAVTGTSTLAYHVQAGVGIVSTAAGAVYAAWADTDTALTTAPETGTATDVIYVDADGLVKVCRDGDAPKGVCILDKRVIAASVTATTSTTGAWKRIFAEGYGASQGTLAFYRETAPEGQQAAGDWTFDLYFTTTETRDVMYTVCQELKTPDVGELNPAAIRWTITVDGSVFCQFEMLACRMYRVEMKDTFHPSLPPGNHHVAFQRHVQWPAGVKVYHFGQVGGYERGYLRVNDAGVAAQ